MATEELSTVSGQVPDRQPDGLWEIADVAQYLKVSIPTIRRHIAERGFPVKRIGGRILFRRVEIDDWVEAQQVIKPAAQQPTDESAA